jgi:hypothetical protein
MNKYLRATIILLIIELILINLGISVKVFYFFNSDYNNLF